MPEMLPRRKHAVDIPTSQGLRRAGLIYAGDEDREEHCDHAERKKGYYNNRKCAFHMLFIISFFMSLNEPPIFLPGLKMLSGSNIFFVFSNKETISAPK